MWKSIFTNAGYCTVIVLLLWGLGCSERKANKHLELATNLEATISDLNQEIQYEKLRLNDSIEVYQAQVKSLTYTQNNLQNKYARLLSETKLKAKDVNAVTDVQAVIHSRDTVIAEVDTFGGIHATLNDNYVNIDVEVLPNRNTIIDYEVRDSLTIVDVQKKHSWLFGLIKWKEHKEVRVINHNPKATIVNLQTIDVIEK